MYIAKLSDDNGVFRPKYSFGQDGFLHIGQSLRSKKKFLRDAQKNKFDKASIIFERCFREDETIGCHLSPLCEDGRSRLLPYAIDMLLYELNRANVTIPINEIGIIAPSGVAKRLAKKAVNLCRLVIIVGEEGENEEILGALVQKKKRLTRLPDALIIYGDSPLPPILNIPTADLSEKVRKGRFISNISTVSFSPPIGLKHPISAAAAEFFSKQGVACGEEILIGTIPQPLYILK